jgi:cytochrome c553
MKSLILAFSVALAASPAQVDRADFFESKIRPLFVSRCASCHGDKVQMAGIQLTTKSGMHTSSVVVPGDLASSRLVQALRHTGKIKMPPTGKLADHEIQAVERWVSEGAVWPETPKGSATVAAGHWAFQPVKKLDAPAVKDTAWPRSDIDKFLLSKLEAKNLHPVQDADKYSLLRRVTIDLTGLLPAVEEITNFEKDSSPQAFERVVDRLLASSAYGDRWGRHWLDVTYWADTTGVGRRIPLPQAWRYRDYVIKSFNEDKPYDQFVREQIAGPRRDSESGERKKEVSPEEAAATGFLALGPWAWFSYDRAQLRFDVADLQVDLVGRTFLGLTLGCARCHDHKFDPIPNKDYYGMAGIFLSTKTLAARNSDGGINMVRLPETLETVRRHAEEFERWGKRVAEVEAAEKENTKEREALKKRIDELKAKPKSEATDEEIKTLQAQFDLVKKKSGTAGDRQILPFTRYMKPKLPEVYAAEDMEFPEDARIAVRGDAHQLGDFTPRRFLSAVMYGPQPEIPPQSSGRKELADWIADEKNPLTARVYVNRIWHHLFGEGIAASTENVGSRGESPTHPELLDYLATRLIQNGWSTKKTIREIVLSHAYQVSTMRDPKAEEIDPGNKLRWRANRRRLEAEAIRDAILQVSGSLDPGRGGPSLPLTAQNVHTIAPFFLEEDSVIQDHIRNRRTIYQPIMRGGQMTDIDILNLFDFADPDQVVGSRAQTVVPTQSLFLLNSALIKKESRILAEKLLNDSSLDDSGRVSRIMLAALNRPATQKDIQQARQFLSDFKPALANVKDEPSPDVAAWARYCHAIFASSEFLYRK